MDGFYLYENVFDKRFEDNLIYVIENDPRFQRFSKTGKIFYQMLHSDFPAEWRILQTIISSLHKECKSFDFSLQLKYPVGVKFAAHYDSKVKWGEYI